MKKVMFYFSGLSIISAFISLCVVIFWLVYPYKVLEIKDPVFPVVNKTVKQNGELKFVSNYCKYLDITCKTSRFFLNEIIYYIPQTTSHIKIGCQKITISVHVPDTLPPSIYYLQNIYEYQVNPIRTITVIKNTEKFRVIK